MSIKIITTEDGSHSLYDQELNETYHSTRGAKGESLHVFIQEGLEYWLAQNKSEQIRVLEIGLGTGLNAFLTALFATKQSQSIHFTTLEPYPVEASIYENLNYYSIQAEKDLLTQIHTCSWNERHELNSFFEFSKEKIKLEHFERNEHFDLIFFDAFAPSKQPEVWSLENLQKCYTLLANGGLLTTYCAQGQFKRNLAEAGFEVETLQGAMGKKEMVRGVKL